MDTGVDVDAGGMREEEVDEPFGWTTIVSRVSFAGVVGRRLDIPGLRPTGKCLWLGKSENSSWLILSGVAEKRGNVPIAGKVYKLEVAQSHKMEELYHPGERVQAPQVCMVVPRQTFFGARTSQVNH
jgi:hypothetical protein